MSADEVDELWAGSIDTEGEAVATPTPLAGSYSQPKPPDTYVPEASFLATKLVLLAR